MTVRDYKRQFGIPAKYALACPDFRSKTADRFNALKAEGKIPLRPGEETLARLKLYSRTKKHNAEVTRIEATRRLMAVLSKDRPWQAADFDEFLRRIQLGRTAPEVAADPDMPSHNAFRKFLAKNDNFRKKYDELWEAVTFEQQVRANKTGQRYRQTIVTLRGSGLGWKEISEKMGVKRGTLKAMWHTMKNANI